MEVQKKDTVLVGQEVPRWVSGAVVLIEQGQSLQVLWRIHGKSYPRQVLHDILKYPILKDILSLGSLWTVMPRLNLSSFPPVFLQFFYL